MKNLKYLIFIAIFSIFMIDDCFAFDRTYKYNYEVTSVTFDGQKGTISGWAILNAGVNDGTAGDTVHGSPVLNRNLESTSGTPYSYSLRVYGININGSTSREVKYIEATTLPVTQTSLTTTLCWKRSDGTCYMNRSPYYDNVGYQFSFNFADFSNSSKYVNASYPNLSINGYKFVLTVKSTQSGCTFGDCTQTFPLTFLASAVSTNASRYFDSSTYMNRVYFIANDAASRMAPCLDGGAAKAIIIRRAGETYNFSETTYCGNKTYYKIYAHDSKTNTWGEGWVPATFIAPPQNNFTVMVNDICDVDGNSLKFNGVENQTTTNSCETIVNLKDTTSKSCVTQNKTQYYTITCEDVIKTEFTPSKAEYYRGDDFELETKVTSYVRCTGVFDYNLWSRNYNSGNASTRASLNDIKNNFINFKMNDYTRNPVGSIRYEVSSGKYSTLSLAIKSNNKIKNGSSSASVSYTDASNTVPASLVFETSTREVVMALQKPIVVNNEKSNTPYKVTITNLGYSKTSKAYFDCEIEKILAMYRTVDPSNPFISGDRVVGENWNNDTYNFVNTIKEETWDSTNIPQYVFMVSRDNIKAIKSSNQLLGASAYLGTDCVLSEGTKKYYCSFLRNQNYFTNVYIRGVLQ